MLVHVAKRRLDRAIFAAAGIHPDDAATYRPMIDALDARLLATEVRDLCAGSEKPGAWGKLADPAEDPHQALGTGQGGRGIRRAPGALRHRRTRRGMTGTRRAGEVMKRADVLDHVEGGNPR
jgi:hypothetical protein